MRYQFAVGDAVKNRRDDETGVPADAIALDSFYHARSPLLLSVNPTQADYVGGTGNDVYTGTSGDDTISGNGGNDTLAGAGGADTIDGGDGQDTLASAGMPGSWQHSYYSNQPIVPLLDTGSEVDTIRGGAGLDSIFAGYGDNVDGGADGAFLFIGFQGASSGVTVDFGNLYNNGTLLIGGGTIANITAVQFVDGSNFGDTISGGSIGYTSPDIRGLGGDDTLTAGYYNSNLYGGDGNDTLDGRFSGYGGNLYGEAGDDVFYGGSNVTGYGGDGNDKFNGSGTFFGGDGNDVLIGASSVNANGGNGDDVLNGTSGWDVLFGSAGADILYGGGSDDYLFSGGNDTLYTGNAFITDSVDTGAEHDRVYGEAGNDQISVGAGDDADGGTGINTLTLTLTGASAGATVDGNAILAGSVMIAGGLISNFQRIYQVTGSAFADTIIMPTQDYAYYAYGGGGNDTMSAGGSSVTFYGDDGNDTITGSSVADNLYGGAGADIVSGGGGDDMIYFLSGDIAAGDSVDGGAGNDTITLYQTFAPTYVDISGVSIANVETLIGTATRMTLAQLGSFRTLQSGTTVVTTGGSVSLSGVTFNVLSVTFADFATTFDMTGAVVTSGLPYSFTFGSAADVITTVGGDDTIKAGGGNDVINSGAGNDSLNGGSGLDVFRAGDGNDSIGVTAADFVVGEIYDGGNGTDTLALANALDISGSTLISIEVLGIALNGSVSMTGAQLQGLSRFMVAGYSGYLTETINLTTGGAFSYAGSGDVLVFNLAAADSVFSLAGLSNTLAVTVNGGIGNDAITGSYLGDFLNGGAGNDRLDGGVGADRLTGGLGNDTFVLDNAGDLVFESAGGGTDTIETSLNNFVLGTTAGSTNVENLTLTGAAVTGSGNGLDNVLTGNALANTLNGGGGIDTLLGGDGNDRLIVGAGGNGTIVDGGADSDTLVVTGAVSLGGLTGVEAIEFQSGGALTLSGAQFNSGLAPNATLSGTGALTINMGAGDYELYLQQLLDGSNVTITVNGPATGMAVKGAINAVNIINGGDGADSIRGGTQADTITGGNGNDKIEGGQGADILTGGAGADTFRYQSASASGLGAAADHITDFVSGTDKLGFLLLDANPGTPGIDPFSYIDTQAFHATGAGEIRYETAGADIVVQVDMNGDGVADMAIYLNGLGGTALASGDFQI